jgi:transcriptional regulator with XRE-family HTH domain
MKLVLNKMLKEILAEEGMTVAQLSRATKIPQQTLNNWLSGLTPRNLIQLKTVADYFETSVDFLLYGLKTTKETKKSEIVEYRDEINAGVFEVVLRRVKR